MAAAAPAAPAPGPSSREAEEGEAPPQERGRGPKPKNAYRSVEEAADARRERNRKAALESYYKKRERIDALEQEVAGLEGQNATLAMLLGRLQAGEPSPLAEPTERGLDAWLQARSTAA